MSIFIYFFYYVFFFYNVEDERSSRQEGLPIRSAAQVKDKMFLRTAPRGLHRKH